MSKTLCPGSKEVIMASLRRLSRLSETTYKAKESLEILLNYVDSFEDFHGETEPKWADSLRMAMEAIEVVVDIERDDVDELEEDLMVAGIARRFVEMRNG